MNIAQQIIDDYEDYSCELDETEANEQLIEVIQGQYISYVSNSVMETYRFRDDSAIDIKGIYYRVTAA